jgi:RNA polymerase sigma-70 factor, ECF subfamily
VDVELAIAERLDRGDAQGAITAALDGYGPELYGYLRAVLHDEALAEDVFAEVCERVWRGLPGFRRECSFRTWAYQVARNEAVRAAADPFARRGRRLATTEASALAAAVASRTPLHERTAAKDGLARLRARLTPDEQTLLILRVDRGLAWTEVAHVLAEDGSPVAAAALRKRFERLIERLRVMAAEEGLGEDG